MKRLLAPVLLIFIVGTSATAQTARRKPRSANQPALPQAAATDTSALVDLILEKYVEAIGGRAAISKIHSRVIRGIIQSPKRGLTGTLESYTKAPNKTLNIFTFPNKVVVIGGFDGQIAWQQNPLTGATGVNVSTSTSFKRDSEFYKDMKLRKLFSKMEFKGRAKVGERDANVIEVTPSGQRPEVMYFDAETGLLLRLDMIRDGLFARDIPGTFYLEDYGTVDGVKIPFTIHQHFPDEYIVYRLSEVKHNVEIQDMMFKSPVVPQP